MGDGGMLTKIQHRGRGLPKKGGGGGASTVCRFKVVRGGGTWQEREGDVFEG